MGKKKPTRAERSRLPADTSQWSESSKRSTAYEYVTEHEDIPYTCRYCKELAIFTAAEQKYTYEVKKRYYWQRRKLCETCFHEMRQKRQVINDIEARWQADKKTLQNDTAFLKDWLERLMDWQRYNSRSNGMITFLARRLEQLKNAKLIDK